MELPLDNNKQNFDAESAPNLRIERRVLTSTETPVHDGYCIAVMRDGALHITPVNTVFQMRPSLAHLDAADERRKEQEKVTDTDMVRVHHLGQEDAEQEVMYGAPSDVPSMATPVVGNAAAAKLMPLQVQVKRRETERQTEMRLHSHAYLKQLEEEERWMQLEPVFQDDEYSARVRAQITTLPHRDEKPGLKGAVPEPPSAGLSISRSIYLDSLCPITSDQLCGVVGDTEDHFRFPEGNTLSKAQLDGLPLDRRIHALFARGQRTVLRFSRVMHFAPAGCDPKDVISALLPVAHLVQGCWVACSALRCGGNARRERVRDHILLQFSRGNRMQTDVFGCVDSSVRSCQMCHPIPQSLFLFPVTHKTLFRSGWTSLQARTTSTATSRRAGTREIAERNSVRTCSATDQRSRRTWRSQGRRRRSQYRRGPRGVELHRAY